MIQGATQKLLQGENLEAVQMRAVMEEIMTARAQTAQIVSFLTALTKKGETAEELTAAVAVMRKHAIKIHTDKEIVLDTCGTGGDKKGTFNISTIAAFVASGCGVTVAKHGNRSVSSCCGSADILEALGVEINMEREKIERCLNDIGIAFLFAPALHPAMKYAMPARKQIASRTMFNILGPLSNPAGATHQLVGVYDRHLTELLAQVLANLGTKHALVVHGTDGLDEITTTTSTWVCEIEHGRIKNYEIAPEDFCIVRAKPQDLLGAGIAENVKILLDILNGREGPKRDIVVLNSAAAIYAADKAKSIEEGIAFAKESIDTKKALAKLESLKDYSKK